MTHWIGLDIGGANIKHATAQGDAGSISFPLWKHPEQLRDKLQAVLESSDTTDNIAATMTGELADCFASKQQGVRFIIDALTGVAGNRHVIFYSVDGSWLEAEAAKQRWNQVAAANWHATANFASRFLPTGNGFLIDIGSSTTDLIPIRDGQPATIGLTDFERLEHGELLYMGVQRTPICGLCGRFVIDGTPVSAANEWFATIDDAFLWMNEISERPNCTDTADGQPATRAAAGRRLARMVCEDAEQLMQRTADGITHIAQQSIAAVHTAVAASVTDVLSSHHDLPHDLVIAGQGEWFLKTRLAQVNATAQIISLADQIGIQYSQSAPAYALSVLAEEKFAKEPARIRSSRTTTQPDGDTRKSRPPLKPGIRIVKVGGSLLDWPELREAIKKWRSGQPAARNVWIVGGGKLVDVVRDWDDAIGLNAETAHWCAIDLIAVTAQLLHCWFPEWPLIRTDSQLDDMPELPDIIFDASQWLRGRSDIPQDWTLTSDSIAAIVANRIQADELVLLKSCRLGFDATDVGIHQLAQSGIVDRAFQDFSHEIPKVRLVNLRSKQTEEICY